MRVTQAIRLKAKTVTGEVIENTYPVPKHMNRQHLMRALLAFRDGGDVAGLTADEIDWLADVVERQRAAVGQTDPVGS